MNLEVQTALCRAVRYSGNNSNSRGSLILWAKCFAVSVKSNLSRDKYESLMQADLYRVAFSFFKTGVFFRVTQTYLAISLVTVSVFSMHPDSSVLRCASLKSASTSKSCPV